MLMNRHVFQMCIDFVSYVYALLFTKHVVFKSSVSERVHTIMCVLCVCVFKVGVCF